MQDQKNVVCPSPTPPSSLSSSSRRKKRPHRYSEQEESPSSSQAQRPPPHKTRASPRAQKLAVQKIHSLRLAADGVEEVLIEWKGYPMKDATWEPVNSTDCPLLLMEFLKSQKASAPSHSTSTSAPLQACALDSPPLVSQSRRVRKRKQVLVEATGLTGMSQNNSPASTLPTPTITLSHSHNNNNITTIQPLSSAINENNLSPTPTTHSLSPITVQARSRPKPHKALLPFPPGLPIPSPSSSSAALPIPDPVATFVTAPPLEKLIAPSFTEIPSFPDILPFLQKTIISAQKIPSTSPAGWKEIVKVAWSKELNRLSHLFHHSLSNPSPMNLFLAVFNFVIAPGVVLGPYFKPSSNSRSDSIDASVHAALNKIMLGQDQKAFKLLCSNGVAKINTETVRALKELHPERKEALLLPSSNLTQLTVDASFVEKRLFVKAGDQNITKDVFGWAPWLFQACRGEKQGFFQSLVNFSCFLANNSKLFPTVCAELISGGAVTPLHKLGPDERKLREETLLPPKLRPINSGSMLAKIVLSAVIASPAGQRAAERVAPFQLSLGTSRGVDKLIHICRAAHGNKWLVGKNDYENGFNSLSRQHMLNNHSALFPESTDVFNFFYGVVSPVFLIDDSQEFCMLQSEQGSRQGCTAGTEGFCFGIHPVLLELQKRYPDFEFRVLTDDVIPLVPPPSSNSPDCWQLLFIRYSNFLRDIKELSFGLGLKLNLSKGALLLPVDAPLPTPEVRALFPVEFEFRQDGMRIAGSPVGTDAFIQSFISAKITEATGKLAAIKLLGKKSPRAAHRLITVCASKLLSFLASTVPPSLSLPLLSEFDAEVEKTFFDIVSPTFNACSRVRFDRARLKASLPVPFGCGLTKAADQAATAWWTSVAACLQDPLLFKLRDGLARFADGAWAAVISLHGGSSSKHWSEVKHLYPDSAQGLLNGTRYSPLSTHIDKTNHISLKTASKIKIESYHKLNAPSLLSDPNNSLTPSDVIHASCRSFSGSIFRESLKGSDQTLHFGPSEYINYCRFFLGLPPAITIGEAKEQAGFDYPIQRCLATHSGTCPFLDASADHASSGCPATLLARSHKHRNIMRVIVRAAQEAGLSSRCEPDTHSLLLGEFSKADCRRVFPKAASKAYKAAFEKLSQATDFIASASCSLSPEEKQHLIQTQIDLLPIHKGDVTGLRVDVCLENMETGETKWIDTSAVHTTCTTYQDKELKAIVKRNLSAAVADLHKLPDVLQHDPSPTLLDREAFKTEKYSRLLMMARKQHTDGKRNCLPSFVPFIVSDFGEISPAAADLQEWLVDQYRKKCAKQGSRADGYTTCVLVKQFRHKLKIGVQLAIAAGLGSMIQSAGQPWAGIGPA